MRSFYYISVVLDFTPAHWLHFPDLACDATGIHLRFLSRSYRSLYLFSALGLLRFSSVLFLVTAKMIPMSYHLSHSFSCNLMPHIFSKILSFLEQLWLDLLAMALASGIGLLLRGRMKEKRWLLTATRFPAHRTL